MAVGLIAILITSILIVSLVTDDEPVHPCSRERTGSLAELLDAAPILFRGTVVDTRYVKSEHHWINTLVEFRVDTVWYGPEHETAYVVTNASESDCGFEFTVGNTYIVVAQDELDYPLVEYCGLTTPINRAQEYLQILDAGTDPVSGSNAPLPNVTFVPTPTPFPTSATTDSGSQPSGTCKILSNDNRWNIRW